jgi:hypothetical protein
MSDEAERAKRAEIRRRTATVEVFRLGQRDSLPPDCSHLSAGERMALVWEILLECLAYQKLSEDELRLQRSVGRVERGGR